MKKYEKVAKNAEKWWKVGKSWEKLKKWEKVGKSGQKW